MNLRKFLKTIVAAPAALIAAPVFFAKASPQPGLACGGYVTPGKLPVVGGSGSEIHCFVYHDQEKLIAAMAGSDALKKSIVDVMRRNAHKIR